MSSIIIWLVSIIELFGKAKNAWHIRRSGILLEWMEPECFKLGGFSHKDFGADNIGFWLQAYFRNATAFPLILQTVHAKVKDEDAYPWEIEYKGARCNFGCIIEAKFPHNIQANNQIPLYFQFNVKVGHNDAEKFSEELRTISPFNIEISYDSKVINKTIKNRKVEKSFDFKTYFAPRYISTLKGKLKSKKAKDYPNNVDMANIKKLEHLLNILDEKT